MFPYNDPQAQLDIYHQRADEMAREAADYRLARAARPGHRRFGRWPRRSGRSTVAA